MEIAAQFAKAFLLGGALCAAGQLLIDKTGLTPARILTGYVVAGVILGAAGLYEPLMEWAGAGASVPLTGFGATLAAGVKEASGKGLIPLLSGGLTAASAGMTAAVFFAVLFALVFKPRAKD